MKYSAFSITVLIASLFFKPTVYSAVPTRWVTLVTACGFGPNVKLTYKCAASAPPTISDIISKMISFNGSTTKGIRIEDSPGMEYPVTGRDVNNNIIIIVDAAKMLKLSGWNSRAILAHELGHITNRDLYLKECVNHEFELNADYYAGFWTRRAGCTNIDSILTPFKKVKPDAYHPEHEKRVKSVNKGWADEAIPFQFTPPVKFIGFPTLKDSYGQYMKIFATITPYRWQFATKKFLYKTKVMISANDVRVPLDRLLSVIAKVEYTANDGIFRFPLLLNANRENDFCYMTIGFKKALPITCTIRFVDNSTLVIAKDFLF